MGRTERFSTQRKFSRELLLVLSRQSPAAGWYSIRMMVKTEWQLRCEQVEDIIRVCGLEGDETRCIRAQLDSLTNLGIQVTHRLVMRADNGLASYWRQRAESAEMWITGETQAAI